MFIHACCSHGLRLWLTALFCAAVLPAVAHVNWSQVNSIDPDCLGLYHVDENLTTTGDVLAVPTGMPVDRGLNLEASVTPVATVSDVPKAIFAPKALSLANAVTLRSTETLANLTGDLTVEAWLKWESGFTSSSVQFGLQSGAKLRITRSTTTPALDQFGIQGTHGGYRTAPGFTNWNDVGSEEAPIGSWLHVGFTIQSTGIHYDSTLAHDVYSTGSTARLYLNGHAVGTPQTLIDVSGLQVHDGSKLIVQNLGGTVLLDEITMWKRDWSNNGTVSNPFSNGRGSGTFNSSISDWSIYEKQR